MEPAIFEGELVLVGMPNTTKFRDLGRDPRFCLHTATVDAYVRDGDAKLCGLAKNVQEGASTNDSLPSCSREAGPTCEGRSSIPSTSRTSPGPHASSS